MNSDSEKDILNYQQRSSSIVSIGSQSQTSNREHDHSDDVDRESYARNNVRIKLLLSQPDTGFTLPNFCAKLPNADDELLLKVRDSARELLIKTKNLDVIDHEELTSLYGIFAKMATPPVGENEKFIDYLSYKSLLPKLSEKCQKMLNARTFVKLLENDPYGRVSIDSLFNYIMRKNWLLQSRIGLSLYDETGKGTIREQQLENWITAQIPTLIQLSGMDHTFAPFYTCTAIRRFMFFLDTNRVGRIKIIDILSSGFLDELLDLREEGQVPDSNWFGFKSTMRIYGNYLNLDTDRTGLLSKGELINYCKGENSLTPTFIDRVFQECLTYSSDGEPEMDYRTYLDFVLAMEYPTLPQSIQYFFRILDFQHQGYLDSFCINYFYKDIAKMNEQNCAERVSFEDVNDEIFDMVKPADPTKITLQDLIKSGCGHKVVSILTDYVGFFSHETRDSNPDNALRLSSSRV